MHHSAQLDGRRSVTRPIALILCAAPLPVRFITCTLQCILQARVSPSSTSIISGLVLVAIGGACTAVSRSARKVLLAQPRRPHHVPHQTQGLLAQAFRLYGDLRTLALL